MYKVTTQAKDPLGQSESHRHSVDTEAHTASCVSKFSKTWTSPTDLQLNMEKTENILEAHGSTPPPVDRSVN